jgi:ubiquitin C-terminal hydrolase
LANFQSQVYETKKTNYDLIAVSNHYGSLNGGHYTATTKNWMDSNWCDRNDSNVSETNSIDSKAAYILFYERNYNKSTRF